MVFADVDSDSMNDAVDGHREDFYTPVETARTPGDRLQQQSRNGAVPDKVARHFGGYDDGRTGSGAGFPWGENSNGQGRELLQDYGEARPNRPGRSGSTTRRLSGLVRRLSGR